MQAENLAFVPDSLWDDAEVRGKLSSKVTEREAAVPKAPEKKNLPKSLVHLVERICSL